MIEGAVNPVCGLPHTHKHTYTRSLRHRGCSDVMLYNDSRRGSGLMQRSDPGRRKNTGWFIALAATVGGDERFLTGRSCSNYQSMVDSRC